MQLRDSSSLWMPSFLHGSFQAVSRKVREEGVRCGDQYRKDGTFPAPRQLMEVPADEVVLTDEVADFQHERPAWRLYMVGSVADGLCEAQDRKNAFQLSDAYEAFCRETAWGALYFVTSFEAPRSAERMALRLKAVLSFWEPLQSVRYLFKTLNSVLTLDELMVASNDWAMDAWCPVGAASVRARLERAAERMASATRQDCLEAIFRELPRALEHARGLKHRALLADPAFLRQRLEMLEPSAFERISGACSADLIGQLHVWDRQLDQQ
jgi:hypothetical protein